MVFSGNNKLMASCDEFEIVNGQGQTRLSIKEDIITLGMTDLHYLGMFSRNCFIQYQEVIYCSEVLYNIKKSSFCMNDFCKILLEGQDILALC